MSAGTDGERTAGNPASGMIKIQVVSLCGMATVLFVKSQEVPQKGAAGRRLPLVLGIF